MILVLANNQSQKFVSFYDELKSRSVEPFEYAGYREWIFAFDDQATTPIQAFHLGTGKQLSDYDGVYLNGYQEVYTDKAKPTDLYEIAASLAIACDSLGIAYVNSELKNPPSFSKLTMHAKLAASRASTPRTYAGTKYALLNHQGFLGELTFPVILKRADADRGIDNYKVKDWQSVESLLKDHDETSLWLLQEFVPNEGYYVVSFYDERPMFSIYRTLEKRPDGDELKAHFYKPKGGPNASLLEIADVPQAVVDEAHKGVKAMQREIASVDCLYDPQSKRAYILEVNYNPQLVTTVTFKDVRQQAFLEGIKQLKTRHK